MANTFKPIHMRNVDLILGDEATGPNFKCQLRSVTLNPNVNVARTKALCPEGTYSAVDDPEWELQLGYLYGTDSDALKKVLGDYLLENHGDQVPFYFRPVAGGAGFTGTVTVVAGPIGGSQGDWSEGSVNLPLDGQPTKVAAPAP